VKAIVLVRHASAGDREEWTGDDSRRPLDDNGRRRSVELVEELAAYDVAHVMSSPARRCVETVATLAETLGLEVQERVDLAEGAGRDQVLALLEEVRGQGAVLCTHGDVVEALGLDLRKGATAVLEV